MSSEEEQLLRRRQRSSLLVNAKRELSTAAQLLDPDATFDSQRLQVCLKMLSDYRERLTKLDTDILLHIKDDTEAGVESQGASDFDELLLKSISQLSARKEIGVETKTAASLHGSMSQLSISEHKIASVKLPKLELAKFTGEPLKWAEFWDSYSSTIHDNDDLSDVDKMKYLRSYLDGDALRTIEGYMLTSANYHTAVEALSNKYGNKQLAIFAHFEAMLNLSVASHDIKQLQRTYDECERHIRSLVALGLGEDTFGQVFTPIILSKLPMYVKFELHRKNGVKPWELSNLREWLREEIRVREYSQSIFATNSKSGSQDSGDSKGKKGHQNQNSQKSFTRSPGTTSALVANETTAKRTPRCCFCGEAHFADQCQKYSSATARREYVTEHKHCYKCLSGKHMAKNCESTRSCFYCHKTGHHRSLCRTKFGSQKTSSEQNTALTVDDSSCSCSSTIPKSSQLIVQGERAILQTALVQVKGSNGSLIPARILFDTGCTRSFVTAELSKKIEARHQPDEVVAIAGFADTTRKTVNYKTIEFDIKVPNGVNKTMSANITKNISCPIQRLPLDFAKNPVLSQAKLADPPVSSPTMVQVDILMGTDFYYDFIGSEQLRLSDSVILLSSVFGYVATGKMKWDYRSPPKQSALFVTQQELPGSTFQVEKFWSLEDIGVKEVVPTTNDEDAVQSFNKSIKFIHGRYYVDWPWKKDEKQLPSNYQLSLGRLKSLKRRLDANPEILGQYDKTIQDQVEKGVVEEVPNEATSNKTHYIPHHCVLTPNKTTTKLRVVYDASAKASKQSASLNECLNRGPVLLDNLCGMLVRFRIHNIGLVSDIEKAFLQVGLHEQSRDVVRFLWLRDPKSSITPANLVEYRFCRVAFGVLSSPFLLGATINHHVEHSDKPVAVDLKGDIYVDNVFNGKETVSEAQKFYREAKDLFKEASMNLREWFTNNSEVRDAFAPEDRGKETETKILGLLWNTAADTLSTSSFQIKKDSVSTKRQMLSNLAKVFDPCGYYSPVTVTGKILIQKLWQGQFGWDDSLPQEIVQEWNDCATDLMNIASHALPRRIFSSGMPPDSKVDIHCFCDASAKAYGACIYLVKHDPSGSESAIVFAKSRVAPIKSLTIPRLELMAVLIGVRLVAFISEQLKMTFQKKIIWSDSQCVLHWLSKVSVETKFVKNRIEQIKEHRDVSFRYVPTEVNPADLVSRGCSYQQIAVSALWWHGPDWIVSDETKWPANITLGNHVADAAGSCPSAPIVLPVNETAPTSNHILMEVSQFSSLLRLLRVTVWVFRFIKKLRRRSVAATGCIQSHELAEAQTYWEKATQKSHLGDIIHGLKTGVKIPMVQKLGVFADEDGLLRCSSRLRYSSLPNDAKSPILLPKNSHFTRLIISDCHNKLYHAGVAQTLANVRLKYHVIHGRGQVKNVRANCRICRLLYGGPFKYPQSPSLPKFRVDSQRPFQFTGIDYMGPLYVKEPTYIRGKVWICLFTCAAIRAVHLEVVTDLTAYQFLMCLRRFVSLFGKPELLVSDNAKQFHASDQFLSKVMPSSQVQDYVSSQGIGWKFITERSPWMGGFYERMVGIVKKSLKTSLDRRCVSLVELQTVTAEVCSIVNSRPITYSGSDEVALTPSHFLKGICLRVSSFADVPQHFSPNNATQESLSLLWKRTQVLMNSFWKTWRHQYLLSLRGTFTFRNHNASQFEPTVGAVVIVKDDLPRASWRLGKIVSLETSHDGKIRAAMVQLANRRQIKRATRLLFPLEVPAKQAVNLTHQQTHAEPLQCDKPDDAVSTISNEY